MRVISEPILIKCFTNDYKVNLTLASLLAFELMVTNFHYFFFFTLFNNYLKKENRVLSVSPFLNSEQHGGMNSKIISWEEEKYICGAFKIICRYGAKWADEPSFMGALITC